MKTKKSLYFLQKTINYWLYVALHSPCSSPGWIAKNIDLGNIAQVGFSAKLGITGLDLKRSQALAAPRNDAVCTALPATASKALDVTSPSGDTRTMEGLRTRQSSLVRARCTCARVLASVARNLCPCTVQRNEGQRRSMSLSSSSTRTGLWPSCTSLHRRPCKTIVTVDVRNSH